MFISKTRLLGISGVTFSAGTSIRLLELPTLISWIEFGVTIEFEAAVLVVELLRGLGFRRHRLKMKKADNVRPIAKEARIGTATLTTSLDLGWLTLPLGDGEGDKSFRIQLVLSVRALGQPTSIKLTLH